MNTSLKLFFVLALVIPAMLLGQSSPSKIAIVDVQKVFDDYYKVKEAMEKRTKSEKIFKDEMTIMENELKITVPKIQTAMQLIYELADSAIDTLNGAIIVAVHNKKIAFEGSHLQN